MLVLLILLASPLAAAGPDPASASAAQVRERVRAFRGAHEREIVGELVELVAIPNLASDEEGVALTGPLSPEARLYGRSASDDKGPSVALLAALDALRAAQVSPSVNLKVFLEGEEEAGSPHLEEMLKRHAALLRSDLMLLCDGPVHQSRRAQLYFGARGVMGLEVTVYGAARTPLDLPAAQALARVVEEAVGVPLLRLPTLGGSVPMHLFQDILEVPVVGLPIVNHDNNQHAADENLRLQNLWDGIEIFAAVLVRLGDELAPAAHPSD